MFLVEQTTVPGASLPVAELRDHLLLGTGFADASAQDAVLEQYLRASISAIEGRTGKALFEKQYMWSLTAWHHRERQALPVAPVSSIDELRTLDRLGTASVVPSGAYRLVPDNSRPQLMATSGSLPSLPYGGSVEIDFTAGYGPSWSDQPAVMRQAVLLLAAHYHENRGASGVGGEVPFGVSGLIERFRNFRLSGGRG